MGRVAREKGLDCQMRRLCPICKSDRIMLWMGGYTGMMYRCPDCEYVGPVTIETDDPLPEAAEDDGKKD